MAMSMRILILCVLMLTTPAWAGSSPTILVFGDSLSAAYGMPRAEGWVALLGQRLEQRDYPHRVVNLSISGETTEGGLRRLPAALREHAPALVLIELGANDALRGQSLDQMRANLSRMIEDARQAGARVLLFEMRIPSNYGPRYTEAFTASFAELGERLQVPVVPFFLEAIALDPDNFLDDGIHPSPAAQPILLDAVWAHLEPMLDAPVQLAR